MNLLIKRNRAAREIPRKLAFSYSKNSDFFQLFRPIPDLNPDQLADEMSTLLSLSQNAERVPLGAR